MTLLRSPRNKLLFAAAAILALALLAPMNGGTSPASVARVLLVGGCLAALAGWFWKARTRVAAFEPPARMRVVSKTGLSPRCGLALVEADGRTFLVAFGDGFAELKETGTNVATPPSLP